MKIGKKLLSCLTRGVPFALFLLAVSWLNSARAATSYYFDVNGTTAGYGISAGGTYSWDGNNWATTSGGAATTGPWVANGFARFYSTAGSYTVTVNASEAMAGMYMNGGTANTLTISDAGNGTGNLSITTTGGTTTGVDASINVQGFLCNGTIVINCPIVGAGGIQHSQTQPLYLNATNSYAGGTWTTGSQLIYYNNSYAFGVGHILVGGSGDAFINNSTSALTITNDWRFTAAGFNVNLAGGNPVGGQPGTTFSGKWTLPSGTTTLFTSSGASQVDKISGVISGSGGALIVSDNGTMILAATNTYTGLTTVGNGSLTGVSPTLEISGKIAGDILVTNSAKLVVDHAAALASTGKFYFASSLASGAINLNFTGSNTVQAVYKDGVVQSTGSWGAPGSGANHEDAAFTGTGFLYVVPALAIVQEPTSATIYPQKASQTFTVAVTGGDPITYQWKLNSNNLSDGPGISGSQTAALTLSAPYTAGAYSCAITNPVGSTNSSAATLTLLATNDYVNAVVGTSSLLAYWRLDETNASANGVIAHDWVGGHNGVYSNVTLNLPGFSVAPNSDPSMWAPKTPLSGNNNKGIMIYSNAAPDFSFNGFPFTLEAWAMSTNFGAGVKQRLISTLSLTGTGGYAFGVPNNTTLEFTSGGIADYDITLSNPLAQGVWYQFVAAFDGNNMNFYVNGSQVGSVAIPTSIPAPANQLTLGNNPLTFPTEQLQGAIDEVAIYNDVLDPGTIMAHYVARYSDLAVPTTSTPVVTPATNYVSLTTTLTESAAGAGLSYQWYKGSGTGNPVGGNSSTLALSNLQLSDGAYYHCVVTDAGSHSADSASNYVAVVPIPTDASQLNLTNGLVLHLPFDADYKDISGRQNDGAAVGAPTFTGSGAVGTNALHYGTTSGVATNYVTLGVRSDLHFSSNIDFTVSYWVRGNNNSLPYFCDSSNGLTGIFGLTGGYYFGPSTNGAGSWEVGLGSATHEAAITGSDFINDGNWHHLVHSVKRTGNMKTYLDGNPVSSSAVSFIPDSIDTSNPANIGQDGLGTLALADGAGDIDDVAVWQRTLTDFEVSGIYLAGATNHVSFAPTVANPPPMVTIQLQKVGSQYQLIWTGGGTLQASPVVTGGYTNVTGAASPYTLPDTSSPQLFYRVQF